MKRCIALGMAFAICAPLAMGDAEAATAKRKNGTKVAGFVQSAPGFNGAVKAAKFGDQGFYRDNTQRFFDRLANSFN
jgi:hypothetical protein